MTSNHCTDFGHRVVVNHEEQYSLWPVHKPNAPGWVDAGFAGSKEECLAYICKHWTDLRPLSLRQALRPAASAPPATPALAG